MANKETKTATTSARKPRTKKTVGAAEKVEAAVMEETKAPVETVDKKDTEINLLKEQIEQLKETIAGLKSQPAAQVVTISPDTPKVNFLWQAEVADDNVVSFEPYGSITGKTGRFFVPKPELSRVLNSRTRSFLDSRWLIVLDGLDEDEREALGVNYKEGEILDEKAFGKIVKMGDEILEIFPNLCESHKEIVAKRYYDEWLNKRLPIKRETVIALYKLYPSEAFKAIKEGLDSEEL